MAQKLSDSLRKPSFFYISVFHPLQNVSILLSVKRWLFITTDHTHVLEKERKKTGIQRLLHLFH